MSWNRVGIYKCNGRVLPYLVRWYGVLNPETGKPRRYSKSFRTKVEADDFKAGKQAEIKKSGWRDRPADESLKRLCEDFLRTKKANVRPSSWRLYEYTVKRLLKFFGPDRAVNSIKAKDADLFMAAQVLREDGEKLSDWSRLQIVNHCRCIFGTAIRWDLTAQNPFKEVGKPKPRGQDWHHLQPGEYKALLDAAPDLRWKAFYALAYTSGAREGELFSLTWGDIDFERALLKIDNRKGTPHAPPFLIKDSEPRNVPLPADTLKILTEWQAEAPEGVPFILLTADRYARVLKRWKRLGMVDDRWENRFMVNNTLRDMRVHAKRAEIQFDGEFCIHTFRKSYGQNLADEGVPIKTAQYLLGHSSEKTTLQFYNRVPKAYADNAREAVERVLAKASPEQIDAHLTRKAVDSQNAPEQVVTSKVVNPHSTEVCEK